MTAKTKTFFLNPFVKDFYKNSFSYLVSLGKKMKLIRNHAGSALVLAMTAVLLWSFPQNTQARGKNKNKKTAVVNNNKRQDIKMKDDKKGPVVLKKRKSQSADCVLS